MKNVIIQTPHPEKFTLGSFNHITVVDSGPFKLFGQI